MKAFDAMCEQYDFTFLKGAGSKVDQNIREFVAMHGKEALLPRLPSRILQTQKSLRLKQTRFLHEQKTGFRIRLHLPKHK